MKKDLVYLIDNRHIAPIKARHALVERFVARIKCKAKIKYNFDYKAYKGKQILVVADHATRLSFLGAVKALKYHKLNFVTGYHNFFTSGLFKQMIKYGCVPKYLYQPDLRCTKDILKLVKMGANIALYIEGIQSTSGSTHPINPATMKLIKKIGLPVILVSSRGSYLSMPRFSLNLRKGPEEYIVSEVAPADEVKALSEEELYLRLLDSFKYNDFRWNEEKGYHYKSKLPLAYGLEKIIYHCPKCGKDFGIHIEGEEIVCECGNKVRVTDTYALEKVNEDTILPYTSIDEWFKDQRRLIQEEIKDESLEYSFDVEMYDLYTDKIRKDPFHLLGTGKMTINKDGIKYDGTINNEQKEMFFSIEGLPSAPFTPGEGIDIYYDNNYYCTHILDEPLKSVKYMLLIEEWHNLRDPKWKKASEDVYND